MRRWFAPIALLFGLFGRDAAASVSIAIPFDKLVSDTKVVGVFTPLEQRSVWEGDRIVTYTRCREDEAIEGELKKGEETWIATLGGRVGDVGQFVDGEPILRVGRPTLLFLRDDVAPRGEAPVAGIRVVTGRAQGQYRIEVDAKAVRRLSPSVGVGLLLPPKQKAPVGPVSPKALGDMIPKLAKDVLTVRTLDEAVFEIHSTWTRTHSGR